MIYATTYQPGGAHRTEAGWEKDTILSLDCAKTLGKENVELQSPEAAMSLITERKVQAVAFGLYGLPQRPVKTDHPKLAAYIRKMFRSDASL